MALTPPQVFPRRPHPISVRKRTRRMIAGGGIALLVVTAALTSPAHAFTWTAAPLNNGGNAFGMWLLTDGRVLSHGTALNRWVVLTPDKTGNYAKGTWSNVAASVHARGGAQQHMFKDGRFFQAGGEFIDGPACTNALCPTTEIYDPVANTWTAKATAPLDIGDTGSATLGDGRILDSTRNGSRSRSTTRRPTPGRWARRCRSTPATRMPGRRCRTGTCSRSASPAPARRSTTRPPTPGSAPARSRPASTPATPAASPRCSTGVCSSTACRRTATSIRPARPRTILAPGSRARPFSTTKRRMSSATSFRTAWCWARWST